MEVTGLTSVSRGYTSRDSLMPIKGCQSFASDGASQCLNITGAKTTDSGLVCINTELSQFTG